MFLRTFALLALLFCGAQLVAFLLPFALSGIRLKAGAGVAAFYVFTIFIPTFLTNVAIAPGSLLVGQAMAEEDPSLRRALRATRTNFLSVVITAMVGAVVAELVIFALGDAGVVLFLGFYLLPIFFGPPIVMHIVAFKRARPRVALAEARELVRGDLLRIFVYLLNVVLITGLLVGILFTTFNTSTDQAPEWATSAVGTVVSSLLLGIAISFIATFQTVLFVSLRAVKESYDTPAMLKELDSMVPDHPALGEPSQG